MNFDLFVLMAGSGSRFNSFFTPKPLIVLDGKPFFFWAINSILESCRIDNIYAVFLKDHNNKFNIKTVIKSNFPEVKLIELDKIQDGPILSLYRALEQVQSSNTKIIIDCDQAIKKIDLKKELNNLMPIEDNIVSLIFESDNPQHGFVEIDNLDNILEIKEKNQMGAYAFAGVYIFGKNIDLVDAINQLKKNNLKEYLMSDLIIFLKNRGTIIKGLKIQSNLTFGTPEEYLKVIKVNIKEHLGWK